jgi:hypothetical protein
MKSFLRIFELSKNEQRVVLIVMLILITIAFVGYQRRVYRSPFRPTPATVPKLSPTPGEMADEQ